MGLGWVRGMQRMLLSFHLSTPKSVRNCLVTLKIVTLNRAPGVANFPAQVWGTR